MMQDHVGKLVAADTAVAQLLDVVASESAALSAEQLVAMDPWLENLLER
jgi:hypothetical protein